MLIQKVLLKVKYNVHVSSRSFVLASDRKKIAKINTMYTGVLLYEQVTLASIKFGETAFLVFKFGDLND